ncbi:MAG: iron ABC transporter permease [Bacteroidota bacterium]
MKFLSNTYFLLIALLVFAFIDLVSGSINIFDSNTDVSTLILELRLPRVLTGFATGGALSLCGLILQIIFRNPLAGPYVLGISGAASLFAAIGIMSSGLLSGIFYQLGIGVFSILGALVGIVIILIALQITSHTTIILLIGILLSQLYSAIQSILSYISSEHSLKIYVIWTMGSIQNTDLWQSIILLIISIAGLILILPFTRSLMGYITGDVNAQILGININRMKKQLVLMVAIIVGIFTAYCGPIALVGMSIPVLVRILHKSASVYQWIIHTFLLGGLSVILTDVINQIFFNGSLPLNVLISIWGVPLMIWILIKQIKWVFI